MANSSLNYHTFTAWKYFQGTQTSEAGQCKELSKSSEELVRAQEREWPKQGAHIEVNKFPSEISYEQQLPNPPRTDACAWWCHWESSDSPQLHFSRVDNSKTCLCLVLNLKITTFILFNYSVQGHDSRETRIQQEIRDIKENVLSAGLFLKGKGYGNCILSKMWEEWKLTFWFFICFQV